jgi:hypothetical protein
MNFFDTLRDKNAKAIFAELAWYWHADGRTLEAIMADMSFEERIPLFNLTHKIMKAVGIPGWDEPEYLNREQPLCQEADA